MAPPKSKVKSSTVTKKSHQPSQEKPSKTSNKKKSTNNYKTYIKRVLESVSKGTHISSVSLDQLDKMVQRIAEDISTNARKTCMRNNKKTISEDEVKLAVNIFFPEKLASTILDRISTAISTSSTTSKSTDGPKRRENFAGLVFSVALSEKFLREFGASNIRVGENAPIALATALEYIVRQILTGASALVSNNNRVTLTHRFIYLAVQEDKELVTLINNFKIEFMGVGVVPHVHPQLLVKTNTKGRRRKKDKNGKSSHKFRPGTVALRKIRKYQTKDSTSLLLQQLPFEKAVRRITSEIQQNNNDRKIHFGAGSLLAIQTFVEQVVTNLMMTTVNITIHASREGINDADVLLAWKTSYSWVPAVVITDEDETEEDLKELVQTELVVWAIVEE
jgi:histone H3